MAPSNFIPMFAALAGIATAQGTAGITTRYWDCCKPSCGWSNVAPFSNPVTVCGINDQPLSNGGSATSACPNGNGQAFMCSSQQPWALTPNLAYGFAALTGSENESQTCCACYLLDFTTGPAAGKQMVVQSTNIGYDVQSTQFDLAIPGGGVGAYPAGCQAEWNAPATGWGAQYGGVSSESQCSELPSVLQPGCEFRFKFMEGANNPNVTYSRVACPAALIAKTNCQRSDDSSYPVAPTATSGIVTSTPPPITSKTPTKTQTLYGQCGGSGWTGPTACPPGDSCQSQNAYYSQCLATA